MGTRIDGAELYGRFAAHGLIYGPAFQGVAEVWAGENEALGRIVAPAAIVTELGEYRIHPALLDACLQVTLATIPDELDEEGRVVFVPSKAERIRFYGGGDRIAWCHMTLVAVCGSLDRRPFSGAWRKRGNDRRDRRSAPAPCRSGWSE